MTRRERAREAQDRARQWPRHSHHIVLAGGMGAGKTTVGLALAERLGAPFLDSDQRLQETIGKTGAQIAKREGVGHLHDLELAVFLEMCETTEPSVIAAAASVVDHEAGRTAMRANFTVWLQVSDRVAMDRQRLGSHRRSVDLAEVAALSRKRGPLLDQVSSVSVLTDQLSASEVVQVLIDTLSARGQDTG